jgi:hypothetical protein
MAQNHYLLRVGDGDHFRSSSRFSIWGIKSWQACGKSFLKNVKKGDLLWFVQGGTGGRLIAVATYTKTQARVLGPLIATTATNEDLGWTKTSGDWDTEVHYESLYDLSRNDLYSKIKSPLVIRKYNDKCGVNLHAEYPNIVRYLKVAKAM